MGRSSRQRNSKEIAGLNNSVDQVDQIDIYRAFCPATAETDSERKERDRISGYQRWEIGGSW